MPNYKMVLAYDGTSYNGWQKQGNTRNTIQGKLEFILSRLLEEEIEVDGSGRTDAGAHAKGQVANFHCSKDIECERMLQKLNKSLGNDIAVFSLERINDRFHSRLNAKAKVYEYRIWNDNISNVFEGRYMFQSADTLDLERMRLAAKEFIGDHDFKAFCSNKRYKKTTVRKIYSIDIEKIESEIRITFCGNGFLYNMVRIMAGTILQAGEGKFTQEDIKKMLESKNREVAGVTLPAQGLTLVRVEY